jgi:hypothetical protein
VGFGVFGLVIGVVFGFRCFWVASVFLGCFSVSVFLGCFGVSELFRVSGFRSVFLGFGGGSERLDCGW